MVWSIVAGMESSGQVVGLQDSSKGMMLWSMQGSCGGFQVSFLEGFLSTCHI